VDNGGVYQFFFNRPEFCFAALETFQELGLDTLKQDYEKCLNEFIGIADSYAKRKTIANDPGINMEKRKKAFADGYKDLPSAKTIEDYFYNEDFKKCFTKGWLTTSTRILINSFVSKTLKSIRILILFLFVFTNSSVSIAWKEHPTLPIGAKARPRKEIG
jgi:hypothetical protein